MLSKLDYKKLGHSLFIEGVFRDSKDSFYYVTGDEVWHVTFVKVEGRVEEWIRELVIFDGLEEFFLSEVDMRYTSCYKSMTGARNFLKKKLAYKDYKDIINEFVKSHHHLSRFNVRKNLRGGYFSDTPF